MHYHVHGYWPESVAINPSPAVPLGCLQPTAGLGLDQLLARMVCNKNTRHIRRLSNARLLLSNARRRGYWSGRKTLIFGTPTGNKLVHRHLTQA